MDKDEEEEDMQALTELQTPDIPESEDPDVVEAEYDVRYCQVFSPSTQKHRFTLGMARSRLSALSATDPGHDGPVVARRHPPFLPRGPEEQQRPVSLHGQGGSQVPREALLLLQP